jgi:hypothetical protein
MQWLDSVTDTMSLTLLATKPQELDATTTQEFVVGASILVQKWKDCLDNYANFC